MTDDRIAKITHEYTWSVPHPTSCQHSKLLNHYGQFDFGPVQSIDMKCPDCGGLLQFRRLPAPTAEP